MISVSYLYDTIQTLIRKDQHGNSFNITEFNRIIKLVNYELYNTYASKVGESIENTEALKDFMRLEVSVTLTTGVGDLPSGYERMLGTPHSVGVVDTYSPIDIVTSLELKRRRDDFLTQPSVADPVAIIGGAQVGGLSQITVYPAIGVSAIIIDYLTIPATPILDYYVASTGLYVYLDEGAENVSIPTGAVYSDGTAGPTTEDSTTVDFEWHEDETPILIDMILQKAGIVLGQQVAIEYGIAKETKEEQQ